MKLITQISNFNKKHYPEKFGNEESPGRFIDGYLYDKQHFV